MQKNILYSGLMILSLFLVVIVYIPIGGTQADETHYNVDISTSPASGFIIVNNMAPGDQVTSLLTVSNNGNLDFNYTVSAQQESGDAAFYNQLVITVSDSKGNLYQGKINGLTDFPLGTIAQGDTENLRFTAELPKEVGNESQGKHTSAAFIFQAVGHEEEISTADCFEPPFSNRNFTLHQKSTVPIKFHLRNENGELESVSRSNVRLEVTGPGSNGTNINYQFLVTDATLKFDENVEEPHYHARFSTFDYPVVTDGTYTAAVYSGDKMICKKEFMVLENGNRSNSPKK